MQRFSKLGLMLSVLLMGVMSLPAQAAIVLHATRVIYQAKDREASVKLENVSEQPVVVQSWLDEGNLQRDPGEIKTPFLLMPPMVRVEPGKGQTLRLMYTGEPLPNDRESVYYLNVLEIPPKVAKVEGQNTLNMALRTRIKVFYRPAGLSGTASSAPQKLSWKAVQNAAGWVLEARNPTGFHVSMTEVALSDGGKSIPVGNGMVDPNAVLRFPLKAKPDARAEVKFSAIDDYGAVRAHLGTLAP